MKDSIDVNSKIYFFQQRITISKIWTRGNFNFNHRWHLEAFKKFFKKSKSATDIILSRFIQLEAALVHEKPLFELDASNFVSLSFAAIIKPLKLELQWVHIWNLSGQIFDIVITFWKNWIFRIHINRILQKCLRIACKACDILKKLFFWSKNSNLPTSFHMLQN